VLGVRSKRDNGKSQLLCQFELMVPCRVNWQYCEPKSLSAVSGDLLRVTWQATESSVQGFVHEWAANLRMVYVVR
jgi:hypothetical protein